MVRVWDCTEFSCLKAVKGNTAISQGREPIHGCVPKHTVKTQEMQLSEDQVCHTVILSNRMKAKNGIAFLLSINEPKTSLNPSTNQRPH